MFEKLLVIALRHVTQKLETSWLVWFGFCFSPVSHITNTRENPWSLIAILAPAAARNPEHFRFFDFCLHADRSFRGGSVGGVANNPGIIFVNTKKTQKNTPVFEPIYI